MAEYATIWRGYIFYKDLYIFFSHDFLFVNIKTGAPLTEKGADHIEDFIRRHLGSNFDHSWISWPVSR